MAITRNLRINRILPCGFNHPSTTLIMTNGNEPINYQLDWGNQGAKMEGLTKREYFAAMRRPPENESTITKMVAEAVMGTPAPSDALENIKWWIEAEEKIAVMHADALIKSLNETP